MVDIDFDRTSVSRGHHAAIADAEQNGHEALCVIAYHQVVGRPNRMIEMLYR